MSGGSLNYYCTSDVTKGESRCDSVRDFIEENGCAGTKAHRDVVRMLELYRELNELHGRLYDVNHDVEWSMSGDIGAEDAVETIRAYTGEEKT